MARRLRCTIPDVARLKACVVFDPDVKCVTSDVYAAVGPIGP